MRGFTSAVVAALLCGASCGRAEVEGPGAGGEDTTDCAAFETCDGLDNDCDGEADEAGAGGIWCPDADLDGYGALEGCVGACAEASAGFLADSSDCDDQDPLVQPAATDDACDGSDQDCDGQPDSDGDCDLDGFSVPDDCDDADPLVHPGAPESCDGFDEDCDGLVDDDPEGSTVLTLYPDQDGDGYGDRDSEPIAACDAMEGYAGTNTDCDDTDPDVNPDAIDCREDDDEKDNDCDGVADDGNC